MQRGAASGISTAEQTIATIACAMFGSVISERGIGLDVCVDADAVKIAQGYSGR